MNREQVEGNNDGDIGMELDNSGGQDPKRFDISGSPSGAMEETVELSTHAVWLPLKGG